MIRLDWKNYSECRENPNRNHSTFSKTDVSLILKQYQPITLEDSL